MAKAVVLRYAVHPGVAHTQKMAGNLAANTGHDLKHWLALIARLIPL